MVGIVGQKRRSSVFTLAVILDCLFERLESELGFTQSVVADFPEVHQQTRPRPWRLCVQLLLLQVSRRCIPVFFTLRYATQRGERRSMRWLQIQRLLETEPRLYRVFQAVELLLADAVVHLDPLHSVQREIGHLG